MRPSSPLPYELVVDGGLNAERTHFVIHFEARNEMFGPRSAGSPFIVYALVGPGAMRVRDHAVEAGERLHDAWSLADFEGGRYHLRVYGPNGFFREFKGTAKDPEASIVLDYCRSESPGHKLSGAVRIISANHAATGTTSLDIRSHDGLSFSKEIAAGQKTATTFESHDGWYDVSARIGDFEKRYAGRVETGRWSTSDPAMA